MIPAHLLGNPWAQEWGNVYDIVQPTDPAFAKRFFLEASVTSKLTHPNTITIFDYGAGNTNLTPILQFPANHSPKGNALKS